METGEDLKPQEADSQPLEERLEKLVRAYRENPGGLTPEQKLEFDSLALAALLEGLAGADREDKDEDSASSIVDLVLSYVDDIPGAFHSGNTMAVIENSLEGSGVGVDYDQLLNSLTYQLQHVFHYYGLPPALPVGTILKSAASDKVNLVTRFQALAMVIGLYDETTAAEVFLEAADELTDLIKRCPQDELETALRGAEILTSSFAFSSIPNHEDSVCRKKAVELNKLVRSFRAFYPPDCWFHDKLNRRGNLKAIVNVRVNPDNNYL